MAEDSESVEMITLRGKSEHLTATSPAEMAAARSDVIVFLEDKLSKIEMEIKEANAALSTARQNGWATAALTTARNRAVDDETFYFKILEAVKAGYTIIPEFPIEIFAVRTQEQMRRESFQFSGYVNKSDTHLAEPIATGCLPAGEGAYRNPDPELASARPFAGYDDKGKAQYDTRISRTGLPAGPIFFPSATARSPIMRATERAMAGKVFDQFGVCLPVQNAAKGRVIKRQPRRRTVDAAVGDPLIIGQVVRKGGRKVVSFMIGWHLNLNDL